MMGNPTDNTSGALSPSSVKEQTKLGLRRFFQQPIIRNSVSVLVPGVLAAALFPIFGPLVAAPAAAVAIQNGLKLLGISFSATTIDKLLKPLEGKPIEEADILDALQEVLPADQQVNNEAAKAVVSLAPDIKEAALQNKRLDQQWLAGSLATNLQAQGGAMATVAPKVEELIQLDDERMREAIRNMLTNWSSIIQMMEASGEGEISSSQQSAKGRGGNVTQSMKASDKGKVTGSSQSTDLT